MSAIQTPGHRSKLTSENAATKRMVERLHKESSLWNEERNKRNNEIERKDKAAAVTQNLGTNFKVSRCMMPDETGNVNNEVKCEDCERRCTVQSERKKTVCDSVSLISVHEDQEERISNLDMIRIINQGDDATLMTPSELFWYHWCFSDQHSALGSIKPSKSWKLM